MCTIIFPASLYNLTQKGVNNLINKDIMNIASNEVEGMGRPSFFSFQNFPTTNSLSLSLCHTSTQTHPNPRSLHVHCFALAMRHKARNRGDGETKKEDPSRTFVRLYTRTDAHPSIPKFCSVLPPVTYVILGSVWRFLLLMCFFKGLIWLQLSFSLILYALRLAMNAGKIRHRNW